MATRRNRVTVESCEKEPSPRIAFPERSTERTPVNYCRLSAEISRGTYAGFKTVLGECVLIKRVPCLVPYSGRVSRRIYGEVATRVPRPTRYGPFEKGRVIAPEVFSERKKSIKYDRNDGPFLRTLNRYVRYSSPVSYRIPLNAPRAFGKGDRYCPAFPLNESQLNTIKTMVRFAVLKPLSRLWPGII